MAFSASMTERQEKILSGPLSMMWEKEASTDAKEIHQERHLKKTEDLLYKKGKWLQLLY